MVRAIRMVVLAPGLLALPAVAQAADCRQALAIGLDVSGSVDQQEYQMQIEGLAAALLSEEVVAKLLDTPETPVMLAVYDWSGAEHQRLILDWVALSDRAVLERVAGVIATAVRIERSPATGVGAAMAYGDAILARQPDCLRATLDLTGDGLSNSGPRPRDVVLSERRVPVTVNALVIGIDRDASWDGGEPGTAELTAWFRAEVIRGPEAFVEVALGFRDFEAAMRRKLIRELQVLQLSALAPPAPPLQSSQ